MAKPPFFLRLLIVFTTIIYGILGLFFLVALFYEKSIGEIIHQYSDAGDFPISSATIFVAGFALNGIAIWGLTGIWHLRLRGFYLFAIPTFLLALYQLIRPQISLVFLIYYLTILILFALFVRKLH
jgi:hypothetical protein